MQHSDTTDGPEPMRKCKPAEKTPNSADQLWQEYEALCSYIGKPVDLTRQMAEHNACPKMKDELRKKRDTAKPTLSSTAERRAEKNNLFDTNCSVCQGLRRAKIEKKYARTKSRNKRGIDGKSRPAKSKQRRYKIKPGTRGSGVAKVKQRRPHGMKAALQLKHIASDGIRNDILNLNAPRPENGEAADVLYLSDKNGNAGSPKNNVSDADGSESNATSNPRTSEGSLRTSYHSNASLEQEPMVEE